MKRLIPLLSALVLVLAAASAAWAAGPQIVMDGVTLEPDVPPYQTGGRVMVPVRLISENMHAEVAWDAASGRVTVTRGDKTVGLTVNSAQALVNGESRVLDAPAVVVNGRTFVPLRFVSETLDCTVEYRPGVVTIRSPDDGSLAYLLAATERYLERENVAFSGDYRFVIKAVENGTAGTQTVRLAMDGWLVHPDQAYMEMEIVADGEAQGVRMYIDGGVVYTQEGDGPWTMLSELMLPLPGADMQGSTPFAQSPEQVAELVRKLGIVTRFGPDEQVGGQHCKVIVYNVNKEQFLKAMLVIMGEWAAEAEGLEEPAPGELDQMVQFVGAFIERLNLRAKMYVSEESGLFVRQATVLETVVGDMRQGMQLRMDGAVDYTDYDTEIEPPDISGVCLPGV